MKTILGIDPGTLTTGFGVIQTDQRHVQHISHGVIVLPEKESLSKRLLVLGQSLEQLLNKYQPDQVVIEKIFMGKNVDSAFKLGHARGVVMFLAEQHHCAVFEYATRIVKKTLAGKGSATKEDVQHMVERILHLPKIERHDASDALALAIHQAYALSSLHNLKHRAVEI